jgi:hypothetical protein
MNIFGLLKANANIIKKFKRQTDICTLDAAAIWPPSTIPKL